MVVRVLEFGDGRLNPLGAAYRHEIHQQLEAYKNNPAVTSVVLVGRGGQHFSAGADISEFGAPPAPGLEDAVTLTELARYVEAYPKPVVAAIRGVAMGGGLEIALACHYRVVEVGKGSSGARLALPEVQVGVIPGAGGTQRLPRLVGLQRALDMILTGKAISGQEALEAKLVDAVADKQQQSVEACAQQWASWAELLPLVKTSDKPLSATHVEAACKAALRKIPPPHLGGEAVNAALKAVRASATPKGHDVEEELFYYMLANPQGAALRHAFFAVRKAQKISHALPASIKKHHPLLNPSPKVQVGVIGAGLMGSGIAMVLLQANFTVYLVDIAKGALQKGVAFLHKALQSSVKKGRLTQAQAKRFGQNLRPTTDMKALGSCKLVVEAVIESMAIKKKVFGTLDRVVPPDALLCSNTSTLSIETIASSLSSPERRSHCAGWHFFSPAHIMKLVEIVVAPETSPTTVAILQTLTKNLKKIGVTVGNCHGFVGNRMVGPYSSEAGMVLSEGGASVERVDGAIGPTGLGMTMGPFVMADLAGNDIGYFIRKERGLTRDPDTQRVGPNRGSMRYSELSDDLVVKLKRLGQKAGKGWYDYDPKIGKGRKPIPSKEVAAFIQNYSAGTPRSQELTKEEIVQRVVFPLVNEAFKILEEGMAQRPSDVDVIYLYGYGWPAWRGGPMFWADNEVGLPRLLECLQKYYRTFPGSDYFRPSKLLEKCVAMNVTVEEYYKQQKPRSKL